jgi:hypothetical protein
LTRPSIVRAEHEDAVAKIAAELPSKAKLVRLDGFMSVGKSCLGRQLAERIHGILVDSDDFASHSEEERPYIDCLNVRKLRSVLLERANAGVTILAAVCSKEVFPPQDGLAEFSVYLKRLSFSTPNWPYWHRDPDVEETPSRALEKSIHEYHLKFRPHEASDLVLEIPEEGHSLRGSLY